MPDYTQSSEDKMSEHNFLQNEKSEEDQSSEDKVSEDSFYQREDSDEGQLLKDKVSQKTFSFKMKILLKVNFRKKRCLKTTLIIVVKKLNQY